MSDGGADLAGYYAQRAEEYERIYAKPERQADLAALREHVHGLLAGHDVLELACGTGYWSAPVAEVARSLVATDAVEEVLDVARRKRVPPGRVVFARADAYDPGAVAGNFTAAFAGFWWSHIPKRDLLRFLAALHRRMGVGARVVFFDNRYVEASSTPIVDRDADGNQYQDRALSDGSRHRVLKNFPSTAELRATVSNTAHEIEIVELTYFWCLSYRVRSA